MSDSIVEIECCSERQWPSAAGGWGHQNFFSWCFSNFFFLLKNLAKGVLRPCDKLKPLKMSVRSLSGMHAFLADLCDMHAAPIQSTPLNGFETHHMHRLQWKKLFATFTDRFGPVKAKLWLKTSYRLTWNPSLHPLHSSWRHSLAFNLYQMKGCAWSSLSLLVPENEKKAKRKTAFWDKSPAV